MKSLFRRGAMVVGVVLAVGVVGLAAGAKAPVEPKMSKFASAEAITGQVKQYFESVQKSLASKEGYNLAKQGRVRRDANLLIVLLMALGLHDQDNPLKKSAPALVPLAEKLMQSAGNYDQAKAACDALADGMKNGAEGGEPLKWEKRYKLGLMMGQVTLLNAKLRRAVRGEQFKKEPEVAAGYAAVLAVIAQATFVDTHEVKDPQDLPKWHKLAGTWRDCTGEIAAGIAAQDLPAVRQSLTRMARNCNNCHRVFRKEL